MKEHKQQRKKEEEEEGDEEEGTLALTQAAIGSRCVDVVREEAKEEEKGKGEVSNSFCSFQVVGFGFGFVWGRRRRVEEEEEEEGGGAEREIRRDFGGFLCKESGEK